MMGSGPPIGLKHQHEMVIDESLTVPHVSPHFAAFADMPPVFATAYMVGFVEAACIDAIAPFMSKGTQTVGTNIAMTHVAPTSIGMTVRVDLALVFIDKKLLRFEFTCSDMDGPIGSGSHERVIINTMKFAARLVEKTRQSQSSSKTVER